ncbi:MAG TPA: M56 family metallopeptidase [Solirubrobacteraceae bacterium]
MNDTAAEGSRDTSSPHGRKPAASAATQVAGAEILLGVLGLASSAFVVLRLLERWRVTPAATSHQISLLGQGFSYPAANFMAIIVLVLALCGLAIAAAVVGGAVRELLASVRFGHRMSASAPKRVQDAWVFEDERPRAFCAGLLRPRVYISSGAIAALDEPALNAVLLHEQRHARRYDPLWLATGRVLARALFFVPGLRQLAAQQEALAELSADESAIDAAPENRSALARAMLSFVGESGSGEAAGIDPARVDHLLGEPPRLPFPALMCLAGLSMLALIVAVAVLAGQLAAGSATLAPPFLSSQPCIVVLAMIPASLGLLSFRLVRKRSGL